MAIVKASFSSNTEFLAAYLPKFQHGGIFVRSDHPAALGEQLIVGVTFPNLPEIVMIRGELVWRRADRNMDQLPGGVGIEFFKQERAKSNYLLNVANGEFDPQKQRRYPRLPIQLNVAWRSTSETTLISSLTTDLSQRGTFIRTKNLKDAGTPLMMSFAIPKCVKPVNIEGKVVRCQRDPRNQGMGISFRCRDAGGSRRLKEMMNRIEAHL